MCSISGPTGCCTSTTAGRATRARWLGSSPAPTRVDGAATRERSVAELAQVFGYVFQSPSQMLFARTVREELLFGPRNLGRDPETFDALIADVLRRTALDQLEGILDRPPLTLSFGQQKRLARGIAPAPPPPARLPR